jgi:hypothetical protein
MRLASIVFESFFKKTLVSTNPGRVSKNCKKNFNGVSNCQFLISLY